QKRQEVEGKECLDAPGVLQKHRGDLVHGLDLLEALLDGRLTFVSLKHLRSGEAAIVAQQRIHAVTFLVVGDGSLIKAPLEVVAAARDASISGVRSGATTASLLEGVFGARDAFDFEVPADVVALEYLLHFQIDAGGWG